MGRLLFCLFGLFVFCLVLFFWLFLFVFFRFCFLRLFIWCKMMESILFGYFGFGWVLSIFGGGGGKFLVVGFGVMFVGCIFIFGVVLGFGLVVLVVFLMVGFCLSFLCRGIFLKYLIDYMSFLGMLLVFLNFIRLFLWWIIWLGLVMSLFMGIWILFIKLLFGMWMLVEVIFC